MREIDTRIKVTGHTFVVGQFPAIVIGDGMHPVDLRAKPIDDSMTDGLGCLMENRTDYRIQRLALNQRHQSTPVFLADHGVTFPVTEASLAIDNRIHGVRHD